MAPSAVPVEGFTNGIQIDAEIRPSKKLRLEEDDVQSMVEEEAADIIPPHPLDVKPSGNAYSAKFNSKAAAGYFATLPDELLMQFLEFLPAKELTMLGSTCKALYAFSRAEELWKDLFLLSPPPNFQWLGTWRSTYLSLPPSSTTKISCANVFSDVLHRPFFCAHAPLRRYASNIPPENAITRLPNLTEEEFQNNWTNKPFILTEPVKEWPVYGSWTTESLLSQYKDVVFRAEAVDWPLSKYVSYMHNTTDESPVYLFDRSFAEKMGLEVGRDANDPPNASYWPPTCFGSDLFSVLGPQRPDCRWLIMGPERSGSTFHKDPNATSAWNAVLTGSKYWLMFPFPPPGIFLSADKSEITSPLSIAEYLLSFHEAARETPGCVEAVCLPGEILHVPSGWFHLVLNLEEGIALTQNFVPRKKLTDVLAFLRDKPDQVTGFKDDVEDPYQLFVERLRESHPDLLEQSLEELEARGKSGRGRWEEIVKGDMNDGGEGEGGGFSFGFGGDDDEEVP